MTLRLFNTLSGQVDEFLPMDGKVLRMYACGPTVYDYGHIGNFRTFLQIDVLRRFLLLIGTPVRHVMNITDVDDKIIRNAAQAGIPIAAYTARFEEAFFEDIEALRVQRPEQFARATEHIAQMVALIQRLAAAGAAYQAVPARQGMEKERSPGEHSLSFSLQEQGVLCWFYLSRFRPFLSCEARPGTP